MLNEDSIRTTLAACFDPQLRLNVVALGLVDRIDLSPDPEAPGAGIPGVPARQQLHLTLLPISEDEAYRAQLAAVVTNRLAGLPELSRSIVTLADTPAWTPARMSAEARRQLKLNPEPFRILNNRVR